MKSSSTSSTRFQYWPHLPGLSTSGVLPGEDLNMKCKLWRPGGIMSPPRVEKLSVSIAYVGWNGATNYKPGSTDNITSSSMVSKQYCSQKWSLYLSMFFSLISFNLLLLPCIGTCIFILLWGKVNRKHEDQNNLSIFNSWFVSPLTSKSLLNQFTDK